MCDYAHIQEHNKKLIQFGGSQSARVPLKMVLLKVLLVTFVSFQVVNYGRAILFNHHIRAYGRLDYNEFTTNGYRIPPSLVVRSLLTTQPPVQLPTVNKEYGHKLEKSEIMPNKFFVSVAKEPWYLSDSICGSRGMILASPQTTHQMLKLQALLEVLDAIPTDESGYWLGGRRNYDTIDNDFYWQFNGKKIDDELWLPSQPNANEGKNCVEFKKSSNVGMKLNNFYCGLKRRYICEVVNNQEYRKNDRTYRVASARSEESHHEIKKIDNDGPAGTSGKENSPTMTTTTNTNTSITSHQTNTTTSSTTTSTTTTTTTDQYYSHTPHWSVMEDPFNEYEEYY